MDSAVVKFLVVPSDCLITPEIDESEILTGVFGSISSPVTAAWKSL